MKYDPLYPNISLYGAPGAGKSTAGAFVQQLGFMLVSFAGYHKGGLRDVVRRMGLNPDDRPTINHVGMKMRDLDPDVWVRSALTEVERVNYEHMMPVVMDDMRGDNEWNQLRARGFVMIHLVVDNAVREERLRQNGRMEGSDMPFLWLLEDTERYTPDHTVDTGGTPDDTARALVDLLNLERSKRA